MKKFFLLFFLWPMMAHCQRVLFKDISKYPVLVQTGDVIGSGFYYYDKNNFYFVTAAHVLFKEKYRNLRSTKRKLYISSDFNGKEAVLTNYPMGAYSGGKCVITIDLADLKKKGIIRYDTLRDVLVIKLPIGEDASFIKLECDETIRFAGFTATKSINFSDLTYSDVFLFGYPVSLNLLSEPIYDFSKPLLISGIISGLDSVRQNIIIGCPSYAGDSGAPVVVIGPDGNGNVIGLVTQTLQNINALHNNVSKINGIFSLSNSSYSLVVPIDFVKKLIKKIP